MRRGIDATAIGDGETQRRSYPGIRGQYGTRGWELVRELDLPGHARAHRRRGAGAADRAAVPGRRRPTLILGSEQMALQIHESVGHAIELDRILGWEAAFAGTSWLDLAQLGSLRYGSELMNITADADAARARSAASATTTRARRRGPRDIVRDGIWVGVLAGPRLGRARRPRRTAAACGPTAGPGCRWCG